jgi:hypothetical protein
LCASLLRVYEACFDAEQGRPRTRIAHARQAPTWTVQPRHALVAQLTPRQSQVGTKPDFATTGLYTGFVSKLSQQWLARHVRGAAHVTVIV